jgi:hypothetical protein
MTKGLPFLYLEGKNSFESSNFHASEILIKKMQVRSYIQHVFSCIVGQVCIWILNKLIVNVDLDDTHKVIVYMQMSMWLSGKACQ